MTERPVYALSLGTLYGGPFGAVPWESSIGEMHERVVEARAGVTSPLNLNVVFHVPGEIWAPEFEGMRTGSYSTKDAHLMIQVALPSEEPDEPLRYLRTCLVEAVEEARRWAQRRKMDLDLGALERLVSQL